MTSTHDDQPTNSRRTLRSRFPVILASVIIGVGVVAVVVGISQSRGGSAAEPAGKELFTDPHIIYRTLEQGEDFTRAAYVPASEIDAAPTLAEPQCLRIAAAANSAVCLRNGTNPAQPFEVAVLDDGLSPVSDEALNGVPSRARVSPDGRYYATTVFVSGHNYVSLGFSTETVIYERGGESLGNLEEFTFLLNGERNTSADHNVWGVTFAEDSNTFYATMATGGRTYLVEGDIAERTLTAIHENAECPSLSPDGQTIVYKKRVSPGSEQAWRFYAFDLTTGEETELGETRSVDDQVAWLDNDHILYGVPKTGGGSTAADIWKASIDGGKPTLVIEDADSPTVVGR